MVFALDSVPPGLIVINYCAFSFSVFKTFACRRLASVGVLGPAPSSQIQIRADEDADWGRFQDQDQDRDQNPESQTVRRRDGGWGCYTATN